MRSAALCYQDMKFLTIFFAVSTVAVPNIHAASIDAGIFDRLEWRNIGPANPGGRASDIAGVPGNPDIVYLATGGGGLFKTTDAGVTWKPLFDREGTISIGAIALQPDNPDVIWVGTGESAVRNSVSFGDGVYRSTDGGATWSHLGLEDTERISRIVVDPADSRTVFVGAQGHAFGPDEHRGVYITHDGGRTWNRTLYIDATHGVSDLDVDPANPNIVYACMWLFDRKPWTFTSGDEKGGVFKSTDGGATWHKLTNGLPKLLGRIGVRVAPSNHNVVYIIAESKDGTVFRSDDAGATFHQVNKDIDLVSRGFYYAHVQVDPTDENRVYAIASRLFVSIDGGRTFRGISRKTHSDYHALWIDPKDPRRIWQGQDGGFAVSHDRGETWETVSNIPLAQFYQIYADNRQPFYWVTGGLQDDGVWTGPSGSREPAGILNDDWTMVSFGDGFYAVNPTSDPDMYLTESQGGHLLLTDLRTREQQMVSPQPWSNAGGPASGQKYRFNWNTPIVVSPWDKSEIYFAGNVLFRSTDFGHSWEVISPDLTTNNPEEQKSAGGPIWHDNSTAENHCTIVTVAESPKRRGEIWAGTDDGNLQLTTDGGKHWTNLIQNVSGLPPNPWVTHVDPSGTSADVAYVSFDRHMFDDFHPYVYKTSDGGKSWTNITGNLPPKAYVWVVREDPKNPNLLYAGTELGLYASWTGGESWSPLHLKNLPDVEVHDLMVHPVKNDLILATMGRSVWILDDATPLQKMTPEIQQQSAYLFDIRPAMRFARRFEHYGIGNQPFAGPNPPQGALITYYLKDKPAAGKSVELRIADSSGKVIRVIKQKVTDAGLQRTSWDLRYDAAVQLRPPRPEEVLFLGGPRGPQVLPGTYQVKLVVGDATVAEKPVEVTLDPALRVPNTALATQLDYALKLRDMESAGNRTLKNMESIKTQLQAIQKTVEQQLGDKGKALDTEITRDLEQLETMSASLARPPEVSRLEEGPRVLEKVRSLFQSLEGVDAAPTAAQIDYFGELAAEYRQKLAEATGFLEKTVPQWNEDLHKAGAPMLIVTKPVEVPKV